MKKMSTYYTIRTKELDPTWMLEEHDRYQPDSAPFPDHDTPNEVFLDKLENIFSASSLCGVPPEPTRIANNVYLGTQFNAENMALLRKMNIRFVLNCAGIPEGESPRRQRAARYKGTNITYEELPIDDTEYFPIIGCFSQACSIIESMRGRRKVLIYCNAVSRSGAVALAFLMRSGQTLLMAARALKEDRRLVCCNSGFMKQLVDYASMIGRLDPEPERCWAPKYFRKLDRVRIVNSHMPDYLRNPYWDLH